MTARHPFHSICPYYAMFPEQFVEQQLLSYSVPGDLVFDPFCGRGTTVFESLLRDRIGAGADINPVAVCIASAKASAPPLISVLDRINMLEEFYRSIRAKDVAPNPFFEHCYEARTLSEIMFLRKQLQWCKSAEDCFIAAMMLGLLHGESHRSQFCLSNRMPRAISTKPNYSVRWWSERQLRPPRRKVFEILRKTALFRYRLPPAARSGVVRQCDVRSVGEKFSELRGQVKLVVTSPPYFDTTDYAEDQWLRLWFLGGVPKPEFRKNRDDRHTLVEEYWAFLEAAWRGLAPLLNDRATIVIRIGGTKFTKKVLCERLLSGMAGGLAEYTVEPLHNGVTTSIRPREISRFRRSSKRTNVEHDFVYALHRHGLRKARYARSMYKSG